MRILPRLAGIVACFLLSPPSGHAAESSRLLVTVNKKTIGRIPDKVVAGTDRTRMQTLVVSVTNQSVRAMPAGVVQWTAVVRKYSGGALKYSGKQDLSALVSFKSAEVSCGSFEVGSYQSASGAESDRLDYGIVILHDGKETSRTVSASNFALLAEKAESAGGEDGAAGNAGNNQNNDGDRKRRRRPEMKPEEPAIIGAEKMPAKKTDAPVAEIAPSAPPAPVALPPSVPQKTFDFFNLNGKKPSEAK